eukprot:scaffold61257_cov34-Tisochrysis_lutea.AAC.5
MEWAIQTWRGLSKENKTMPRRGKSARGVAGRQRSSAREKRKQSRGKRGGGKRDGEKREGDRMEREGGTPALDEPRGGLSAGQISAPPAMVSRAFLRIQYLVPRFGDCVYFGPGRGLIVLILSLGEATDGSGVAQRYLTHFMARSRCNNLEARCK